MATNVLRYLWGFVFVNLFLFFMFGPYTSLCLPSRFPGKSNLESQQVFPEPLPVSIWLENRGGRGIPYLTLLKHVSHESTFLAIDFCSRRNLRFSWKSSSRVCTTYCRKRSQPGGFS